MAPRSSRAQYRAFVEDYKKKRLDDVIEARDKTPEQTDAPPKKKAPRRYIREYLAWLKPHRYALAFMFLLAIIGGGLEMVEPLFLRHIIDKVLLNKTLTDVTRLLRLNTIGAVFLALTIFSNLLGAYRNY